MGGAGRSHVVCSTGFLPCGLKESSEKGEVNSYVVYSEEGGHVSWTNKKGNAAAVTIRL